jgi:2-(1,2-epoxy-1,2-dihydrophenyl)acetyl-CoA isomerase
MSSVLTTRTGAVLTVTLNRPEVLNAIDATVHAGLRDALAEAADPAVRAVVVTGAGRGFCVGQDLNELRSEAGDVGEHLRATYHRNVRAVRALEKPVLAAVNGPVAGAGLSLALVCDLRIASDAAVFVPGFIGIGLVPDAGGTWFAERLLGQARAFEWLPSNRRLTAAEALEWGLVSEVVPAAEFEARTAALAEELAAKPTRAVWQTKRLLELAATTTLEQQLELEAEAQTELARSPDAAEGVAAFVEKRAPRFSGS